MVYFVGAGPGAEDLITVRGARLLAQADVIIYTGSLVNPELLSRRKSSCEVHNSAMLSLEQVTEATERAERAGKMTVRLHTGDPCLYGAIREQMEELKKRNIPYEVCPGVSSFCGAAASLNLEYTLPGVSQSVVITRMEGRTPVPDRESVASFASHKATMVLFLSAGMMEQTAAELIRGGYDKDTPAAVVYKATWPDEKKILCTVGAMAGEAALAGIDKTALIIVGPAAGRCVYERSKLYDPAFSTGYRKAAGCEEKREGAEAAGFEGPADFEEKGRRP